MRVSEQVFTLNHVARLTPEEVQRFAVATYITGWTDGLESVKPECGPQGKEADRSTVKLYVSIPEDAPSEIASGVRSHLRSLSDVRIVYVPQDADVAISILAIANKSRESNTIFGYTAALVASRPCILSTGKSVYAMEINLANVLETAATVEAIVLSLSADLDTDVCEKVRSWNEAARKEVRPTTSPK